MDAVVAVDTEQCMKDSVQFWTDPSGAILTRENIIPRCMISIVSMDGSHLWTHISENTRWARSQAAPNIEEVAANRPETPPDSEDTPLICAMAKTRLLRAVPKGPQTNQIQREMLQSRRAQGPNKGEDNDMAVDVESGAARPAKTIALTEHPDAPPRDITLVENPKAPTLFLELKEGLGAASKAEEAERRHDIALSLLGNGQRTISEKRPPCRPSWPSAKGAKSKLICRSPSAQCAPPASSIPDASGGAAPPYIASHGTVFKDITHRIIKYTDRAATDREHSWAQQARKQAQSACKHGVYTIMARCDDSERFLRYLLNNGWARRHTELMQCVRDRPKQMKFHNAKASVEVQESARDYAFTADPMVRNAHKYALLVGRPNAKRRNNQRNGNAGVVATRWQLFRAALHGVPLDGGTTTAGHGGSTRESAAERPTPSCYCSFAA